MSRGGRGRKDDARTERRRPGIKMEESKTFRKGCLKLEGGGSNGGRQVAREEQNGRSKYCYS